MRPSKPMVFVGWKRSPTAIRRDWTWYDGHLSAATLWDALRASGIRPEAQVYRNLCPDGSDWPNGLVVARLIRLARHGVPVIALGQKVYLDLVAYVPHLTLLRHPAARGAGRKRNMYQADVAQAIAKATGDA